MRKLSLRIIILCLIISIGTGIGIGQAIAARQIGALDSQIGEQEERLSILSEEAGQWEEQLSTLQSKAGILQVENARLSLDIEEKQASYDLLLDKQSSTLEDLVSLRASFTTLSVEYQGLRKAHETLKEASNGVLVEELSRLREQISFAERQLGLRDIQIALLTRRLTPAPHRDVAGEDIWGRPEFRSIAWEGRDIELKHTIEEIARTFHRTHTFIEGEFDCNDMAVSLWNMLLTAGIKSVIVVGNLEMAGETFAEANHSWLFVFNSRGEVIYLEPTTGEVFFGRFADGSINPRSIPYREGDIYVRPSDLRRDLKDLW